MQRLPREIIDEVFSRKAEGQTHAAIAEAMGRTKQSVDKIVQRYSLSNSPSNSSTTDPPRGCTCKL
jgi:plasmid maintenance system antidote protein VapI